MIIPALEYLRVKNNESNTFVQMLNYMSGKGLPHAGAVHDFTCPQTGKKLYDVSDSQTVEQLSVYSHVTANTRRKNEQEHL